MRNETSPSAPPPDGATLSGIAAARGYIARLAEVASATGESVAGSGAGATIGPCGGSVAGVVFEGGGAVAVLCDTGLVAIGGGAGEIVGLWVATLLQMGSIAGLHGLVLTGSVAEDRRDAAIGIVVVGDGAAELTVSDS